MLPLLTLVTLPSPSTFIADVGAWSSPIFNDLYPLATYGVGVVVGGLIIFFIMRVITNAVRSLIK